MMAMIFTAVSFSFAESDSCNENGNNGSNDSADDGTINWQLETASATVTNIDRENNEVTLKDEDGNTFTVTLDKKVDLSQISNGDKVNVQYYRSLATDFREPTAEDQRDPLVITDETIDAPEGTEPTKGDLKQIRAVVKIQNVDKDEQTVTVKGPMDNEYTLYVSDSSDLDKLKEGESITVTYTEALAVSLQKAQ